MGSGVADAGRCRCSWPDAPFEIRPLSVDEGGGYLISYPDLSECISDGETVDEAIANGRDALQDTVATLEAKGFAVPTPNGGGMASGKFVARAVPETIYLADRFPAGPMPGPAHK